MCVLFLLSLSFQADLSLADVEIGSHMANAFESTRSEKTTASQAYQRFIDEDKQLEGMLANLPAWLRPGGPTTGMPDCADVR